LETDRKRGKWLTGKSLIRKAREADQVHYCQLGKMYVAKASNKNKGIS